MPVCPSVCLSVWLRLYICVLFSLVFWLFIHLFVSLCMHIECFLTVGHTPVCPCMNYVWLSVLSCSDCQWSVCLSERATYALGALMIVAAVHLTTLPMREQPGQGQDGSVVPQKGDFLCFLWLGSNMLKLEDFIGCSFLCALSTDQQCLLNQRCTHLL